MNIPKSFQLGGTKWEVRLVKRLKEKYGDCDMEKSIIRIKSTIPQQLMEQTFLHEAVHAMKFAMGETEHDEVHTDAFATLLHQFLTSQEFSKGDSLSFP